MHLLRLVAMVHERESVIGLTELKGVDGMSEIVCPDCGRVLNDQEPFTSWTQYECHKRIQTMTFVCSCGTRVLDVQEELV